MHLGENLHNAFEVVNQTYQNIDKLLKQCKLTGERESHYIQPVSRFLRYKSDNDWNGWFIKYFIVLFQRAEDRLIPENQWRDGPVFAMEINLLDEDVPTVYLSKFEYSNIKGWTPGCSPASYRFFYEPPVAEGAEVKVSAVQKEHTQFEVRTFSPESDFSREYWGVTRVVTTTIPLVEINASNLKESVFGAFDLADSI